MIPRILSSRLLEAAGPFPVVFLTGPRQAGKTTLARATFPDFLYLSLEDLQVRDEAMRDPRGFLHRLEGVPGAILDEVQRAPDLFSYIQGHVDDRRGGPLILTGSQHFLLSERISQSLAGRAAVLELMPLSLSELFRREPLLPDRLAEAPEARGERPRVSLDDLLFRGLFPRIHDAQLDASLWLGSYLATYVERDARTVSAIGDLDAFSRFLALCAGRASSLVNLSSLGADAGVTHTTARRWLSVLEASYVIQRLPPYFRNFSKRVVKSPKLYFTDTGLLCHLLGIRRPEDIRVHPLRGAIFENFVVGELHKLFLNRGERPPLYFWRSNRGHEIDVLIDLGVRLVPVEIKSGMTLATDFFDGLERFAALSGSGPGVLVYGGDESYERQGHIVRAWWDVC